MNILIIGGGIGGPALATLLAKQGENVTLIEKSSEWKHVGYGVTLWGIGRKILRELGIDHKLERVGHPVPSCDLKAEDGSLIINLDFKQFAPYGGDMLIVHRSDLHQHILETIPSSVEILLGTTVTTMEQSSSGVDVVLSNGTTKTFDLVVGADGVHSPTRSFLGMHDVTQLGWSVEVFWVPEHIACSKKVVGITESYRTLCFYPIKDRTFIAIARHHSAITDENESFITPFIPYLRNHGWSDADITTVTADDYPRFKDELTYITMNSWSKDRIALLGDARHAFAPVIGMGANLALEDAWVLAEELKTVSEQDISQALIHYEKRRTGRVNNIRTLSRFIEPWFNASSPRFVHMRKKLAPILSRCKWILGRWIIYLLKKKI